MLKKSRFEVVKIMGHLNHVCLTICIIFVMALCYGFFNHFMIQTIYVLSSELVDIPLHFHCMSALEKVTTNLSQHHL